MDKATFLKSTTSLIDFTPNCCQVSLARLDESIKSGSSRKHVQGNTTTQLLWDSIALDSLEYPLRKPLSGRFSFKQTGVQLWMDLLSPTFVGEGRTQLAAENDLKYKVHESFQLLYHKRPFQMVEYEQDLWGILCSTIDVYLYSSRRPIIAKEIGKVIWPKGFSNGFRTDKHGERFLRVKWLDGRCEWVSLTRAPDDMITFRPGTTFEALTNRYPKSHRIHRIKYAKRIENIVPENAEGQKYNGPGWVKSALRSKIASLIKENLNTMESENVK